MYGLVNNAIQSFVTEQHGTAVWNQVRARASVRETEFVSMQTYPDDLTYALVGAAHVELGVEVDAFLESLGEYWITYAAEKGHGGMLDRAGRTFVEVLQNLDAMHARIALTFPELKTPSFRVRSATEHSLDLHYYSPRQGLLPFVRGLLFGLAKRFATQIELEVLHSREAGHDHDVLVVRMMGTRS